MPASQVQTVLEELTGEHFQAPSSLDEALARFESGESGLGYSQLNELLLLCGLDRITHAFFAYLLTGSTSYEQGKGFGSLDELRAGVARFRKDALLQFGNVKFAFKSLSRDVAPLQSLLDNLAPIERERFERRHEPILPMAAIAPEEAYLTGYLIEQELEARLEADPTDAQAQQQEQRRKTVVEQALKNHRAYLASDHLDVYVATSMRAQHEFLAINRLTRKIFGHSAISSLNLRWFDPTQAYCSNRIDKGLAEALMLRRASCTIYLAQESDTLGKDSELASTLAQGKPVIAYVPGVDSTYLDAYFADLERTYPDESETSLLLEQLRLFEPDAAWSDATVRSWCESPDRIDVQALRNRVSDRIKTHYDSRARTLKESHPLAIQVNLATGVATGVLVVRNPDDCAELLLRIVTGTLEFELDTTTEFTALRERISGCIFRVITADAMLTNTFWNFYLNPAE